VLIGRHLVLTCLFVCVNLLALSPASVWADGPAAVSKKPPAVAKGQLLIANPTLMDPNFRHSVVLICEHNDQGTLGLILNRPTDVLLSEALPALSILKATSYVLFWGGPVQQSTVLMLFRLTQVPTEPKEVMTGVYLGAGPDTLTQVITQPNPTETFRAYAGYAGWAVGQLEHEMAMGSWALVSGDGSTIFDRDPSTLWADLVEKLISPRVIHSNPGHDEQEFASLPSSLLTR
jgi:putative transcriptional regulator